MSSVSIDSDAGGSFPAQDFAPLSDAELLSHAARGDHGAYAQFVTRHQDRLYNSLFRLVGDSNEAAELAHEAVRRALARIDEFEPSRDQPYSWLFGMALNLAVTALRRTRRSRDFGAEPALAALGRIELDYRTVLIMRDLECFDYQQMSDLLSLPAATVKSRLFRARLALRDELRSVG